MPDSPPVLAQQKCNNESDLLREQKRRAGLALGRARRAATAERDAALARQRALRPGISLAKLGEPYGLSRSAVLRAIRRARRDPETDAACRARDDERRAGMARLETELRTRL